jgi:hypothetical protein
MSMVIDLPPKLAERLETYLIEHPEESLVDLIQEVLDYKFPRKDSSKLLELAGIVSDAPFDSSEHAEDRIE